MDKNKFESKNLIIMNKKKILIRMISIIKINNIIDDDQQKK